MHTSRSPGRWSLAGALVVAALTLGADTLSAQQGTGMVSGTVTDRASGLAVARARVEIVGAGSLAANTDDRGQYFIRNVPTGQQSVRATRIGFRPATQSANVTPNDTTRVDFAMGQSAVELQTVVVTGTGGAVEKRQIGSSIGSLDVAAVQEVMPVSNFSTVLGSKVSGVRSVGVGGGVGSGQDLRIRGIASFSLNQRPVIYIDGVRVDSRGTDWSTSAGLAGQACCNFNGGNSADRLGDLNPNDIERVEILKGASAATLYGSEATNGVIQVFTKKGRGEGRTQWNLGLASGFNRMRENVPTKNFPRFTGPDGTRARDANDLIENGPFYSVDLSGQGGTQRSTYFVSGLLTKEDGSIQPNDQFRGSIRANVAFVPNDKTTVEVRSSYVRNTVQELQGGNNWVALLGNAINGNPRNASATRPYGEAWTSVADVQKIQTMSDADRWTGGITLSYALTPAFTHRLIFGTDVVNEERSRFFPYAGGYGTAGVTFGQRTLGYRNYRTTTVDYLGALSFSLPGEITSNFSFGGQGFWESQRLNNAVGSTFPGPGVSTVASAAVTSGGEAFTETVNLGLLAQNRFGWKDRLFFTVGARMDGNSAFGDDFGFQTYPKADVSYDVSQHEFLPEAVSSFRVRSSWGKAGKMPGPFDSFISYGAQPVFESTPGIVPLNPGNKDLKPEVTTEQEFGFDLGLWGDRVSMEASYYNSETTDAIVNRAFAPSQGFSQAQNVNIGALENKGWEASLNLLVFSRSDWEWSTGFRADGNKNKVTDLGGVTLPGNAIRLGYPVQGVWSQKPTGFSVVTGGANCAGLTPVQSYGCPTTTRSPTQEYFGPPLPTFNGGWSNTVRFKSLSLYSLVSMESGAWFNNGDRSYRIRQGGSDELTSAYGPNGERTFASDSIYQWVIGGLTHIDKRDNVRLREVSLTWQVPERFSSAFKTGRTSVSLAGYNLMWWDDCHCMDPNMNWAGASSFTINSGFLATPSPRQYRVQVRTRF